MSEKDLNLELDIDEILENENSSNSVDNTSSSMSNLNLETIDQGKNSVDESVFLEPGDSLGLQRDILKDGDKFGNYLRWFFFSTLLTLLGVLAIALLYSFRVYINDATDSSEKANKNQEYTDLYKEKYRQVKNMIGTKTYDIPDIGSEGELQKINDIITASDIDYIDKKDLLSGYVSNLSHSVENGITESNNLKQELAKQGFLPEELETLLSEDQAIDTIQRSLNALEVIKFSTASKVFSYMNTALQTIVEMIRISGVNIETLHNLLEKLNSRGEKDIASYVYMCYLNPFEINANCDIIGDLDLYYQLVGDTSIDIKLFKNAMHAISQLLEKEDTSLFSITFNGFNAADKSIKFNIEVYTKQEDERVLISQGKKNPNIFILTNIINLLKQSSFIIGAEINPKEINVDTKMINQGGINRPVNYSTMDFVVPIQKNTEREIFDYIDLESMKKLLSDRGYNDELIQNSDITLNNEIIDMKVEGESPDENGTGPDLENGGTNEENVE